MPSKSKKEIELTPEDHEHLLKDFKIRPNSDIFFASYFSNPKHEASLVNFINSVMLDSNDRLIESAEVLNPFNVKKFAVDKNIVLDVRVQDERKHIFDIEMQVSTHLAFKERMLEYWADTYSSQLFRGGKYAALKPVVSIIITFDNLFPQLKKRHQVFHLVSDENPSVMFSDHIAVHVVCLSGVRVGREEKIRDWNDALQGWSLFLS
ncbi:MAG: Rpn family recombination-promoting nuclease/putative transposase, partial [Thermoguttaceae bacterium]